MRKHAIYFPNRCRHGFGLGRLHRVHTNRLAPFPRDQLHRLRQIERRIRWIGWNAQQRIAPIHVRVTQPEPLAAEHKGHAPRLLHTTLRQFRQPVRCVQGWPEVAHPSRQGHDQPTIGHGCREVIVHLCGPQHIFRAARKGNGLGLCQHIGKARRNEAQAAESHVLDGAGGSAHIARMTGADEDENRVIRQVQRHSRRAVDKMHIFHLFFVTLRISRAIVVAGAQDTMHPMLNVAVRAAREAGKIINRASLDIDLLRVAQKAANDFVTEVDRAAEQAIIDVLLKAFPQHGILGEETGSTFGDATSDYQWIIDPLDGTTNFIHGMPVYAVSIALAHRGVVQQAVVYDPTRDELFTATRGAGAFLNSRRIRVSNRVRLEDSLIGTGFPFRKNDDIDAYLEMFKRVAQRCVGLRRPGAAAIDLAYVAAGRYDGFFETGLKPWDIAAGSLLITEAGGLVGNFAGDGDFLHSGEVLAATPRVYAQLVALLQPFSKASPARTDDHASSHSAASASDAQTAVLNGTSSKKTGTLAVPEDKRPGERAKTAPRRIKASDVAKPRETEKSLPPSVYKPKRDRQ